MSRLFPRHRIDRDLDVDTNNFRVGLRYFGEEVQAVLSARVYEAVVGGAA